MATQTRRKPAAKKPAAKPAASSTPKAKATASEVAVGYPTLTSGSADLAVLELTERLRDLGYECPIQANVDASVLGAVNEFREAHNVTEDPDNYPGGPEAARYWVGPDTWAAVLTA